MRRVLKFGLNVLAFLLAGAAILAALGVWRLSSGPISIDVLTPYVEQALSTEELRVEIDNTLIQWEGFGAPLQLAASGVRVSDGERVVATVPGLFIGLDVPALVLDGALRPDQIALVAPEVHVIRTEAGEFRLTIGDTEAAGGSAALTLLDGLLAPEGSPDVLYAVRIAGGTLTVEDRRLGVEWRADSVDAGLARVNGTVTGRADLIASMGDEAVPVAAALRHDIGTGETAAELQFSGLVPADLPAAFPVLAPLAGLDTVIAGEVTVRLDPDLRVQSAGFALRGGAGRLDLPEYYDEPVSIAAMSLAGRIDVPAGQLQITRLIADFGGPHLVAEAGITLVGGTVDMAADVAVRDMPMAQLHRYWPEALGGNARPWILENITDGTVRLARALVHLRLPLDRPDPEAEIERIAARLVYDGLSVTYLDNLPPVTGVSGTGGFDGDRLALHVDSGGMRDLTVQEGQIVISEFDVPGPEPIDIRLLVSGPFSTALAVLDRPGLGFISDLGLDPAAAEGMLSTRLHFTFPLASDLALEELGVGVSANLRRARLGNVFAGLSAEALDATLELDGRGLTASGSGRIEAVPVDFTWRESFRLGNGDLTRIELSGTLSEAAQEALGLPLDPYIRGPVGVDAVYRDTDRRNQTLSVDADLTAATLTVDVLDWVKPPGVPAEGALTAAFTRGELRRIPAFSLTAPALSAAGSVTFDPGTMAIAEAIVERFAYERTRIHGRITAVDDGYSVQIAGPSLDATPWLAGEDEAPDDAATEGDLPPIDATVELGELILDENRVLYGVSGSLVRGPDRWESADLVAHTADGANLQLLYEPAGPTSARLTLRCDDVGGALDSLGVLETVTGGQLTLVAMRNTDTGGPGGDTYSGQMVIDGLHVVDAPLLAELLAATSPGGLQEMLRTEGIRFDRIEADGTLVGDRLEISEGRAVGGALGMTLAGTVDLDRDAVDLSGTIVPVYGLNRAIGRIPLLGDLLTGGEGGGLFAFTYRVTGPLDDPDVRVNPLSVLAPGFLRDLFFLGNGGDGGGRRAAPPGGGSPGGGPQGGDLPGPISERPQDRR